MGRHLPANGAWTHCGKNSGSTTQCPLTSKTITPHVVRLCCFRCRRFRAQASSRPSLTVVSTYTSTMSDQAPSRFTAPKKTTTERLSSNTVGLVQLSDYRKRHAEVLDQQEREREAALSGTSTPNRSHSATPDPGSDSGSGASKPKKRKKKIGGSKLSFGDDEEEEEDALPVKKGKKDADKDGDDSSGKKSKVVANSSVAFVPKVMSKAALRREAAEREALRREFLAIQEAVKATEIAVPFVFYDGSNIPGGTVRVKKGDYVWVFLDKSRKVGAELGVGEKANARREWARVGVDDLMLVRGSIIIPHVGVILSLFLILG